MRLINVHTYKLREFFGSHIPKTYAILSHTWGDEEVTFQEFQAGQPWMRAKTGFAKIQYTCEEAKSRKIDWVWVDTCCIDKTSSAELSEAINSMFAWYEKSEVCFAYLDDVGDAEIVDDSGDVEGVKGVDDSALDTDSESGGDLEFGNNLKSNHDSELHTDEDLPFRRSRWFFRGWTLQELIAPPVLVFFSRGWQQLGTRSSLSRSIEAVTRIPERVLLQNGELELDDYSVAQRMSWASARQTTREEDIAYCLMGVFRINMPLLCGEGTRAFRRLQEEIIKQTDDHSLFAWAVEPTDPGAWSLGSVFAASPANFSVSSKVQALHGEVGESATITNKGLRIDAAIVPLAFPDTTSLHNYGTTGIYNMRGLGSRLFQVVLNCVNRIEWMSRHQARVVLWVMRQDQGDDNDGRRFHRVMVPDLLFLKYWHETRQDPNLAFRVRNADFQRIYISGNAERLSPFSACNLHFQGIPLIFPHHHYPNSYESLWVQRWCLLLHARNEGPNTCQRRYRFIPGEGLQPSLRPTKEAHSAYIETWCQRVWLQQGLDLITVSGDPGWDEYPMLICGNVSESSDKCPSTPNCTAGGLVCWFVPSLQKLGQEALNLDIGSVLDSFKPPVLHPNGRVGPTFLVEAKCGESIINLVIFLEPDQLREGHVQGFSGRWIPPASSASQCLFIFRQFPMDSPPPSDGLESGHTFTWLDKRRTPWSVDSGSTTETEPAARITEAVANIPPGEVRSDLEGLMYMDLTIQNWTRQKLRRRRRAAEDGSAAVNGKLEWCKVYTFDDSDKMTLQTTQTYYDEGGDADGSAEARQPVACPPGRGDSGRYQTWAKS